MLNVVLHSGVFCLFQFEVFNILFVSEVERKHVVHCVDCAQKISPRLEGFVILNQYKMSELMEIYDNFQLGNNVSFYVIAFQLLPELWLAIKDLIFL